MDYGSFNHGSYIDHGFNYGSWIIDHGLWITDYGSFNHIDYHIGSCWIILDHTGS